MTENFIDNLSDLEVDNIQSSDIYFEALKKQFISKENMEKLFKEEMGDKYKGGDIFEAYYSMKKDEEVEKYVNIIKNTFKKPEKYIKELKKESDYHNYTKYVIKFLLEDYGFTDFEGYERKLESFKGNTLEEKLESYRNQQEYSIINEDLFGTINELIWDKIKHNYVDYDEQNSIIKLSLKDSLTPLIGKRIKSLMLFDFTDKYAQYINNAVMCQGQRIGMIANVTLFQDLQQGALKNFSSSTKIVLGIPGDTFQSFDNFNCIINLSENPIDAKNIIHFTDSSLKNVFLMNKNFLRVIVSDVVDHIKITKEKIIEVKMNFAKMYKYKITISHLLERIETLDELISFKTEIDLSEQLCLVKPKKIKSDYEEKVFTNITELGKIQKLKMDIENLLLSGMKNVKNTEIVNIHYGKILQEVVVIKDRYHIFLSKNLMARFDITNDKFSLYMSKRLKSYFNLQSLDVKIEEKGVLSIPIFLKDEAKKIKLVLLDLPLYVTLNSYTKKMKYENGEVVFADQNMQSAYISTFINLKMDEEDFNLLKKYSDYYIDFEEGLAKKGDENIVDEKFKKFKEIKYINQTLSNEDRIWYIIARPISSIEDHLNILRMKGVNRKITTCNNPDVIFRLYGISAVTSFLQKEISGQVSSSIAESYPIITSRAMTCHGIPVSATRNGLVHLDRVEGENSKSGISESLFKNFFDIAPIGGKIRPDSSIKDMIYKK